MQRSPVELARLVLLAEAKLQRTEERLWTNAMRRCEPAAVAEAVCRYVERAECCLLPGDALTLDVEQLLPQLGVGPDLRGNRPGMYEAIFTAALVGMGFVKGTRGKATVYRRRVRSPAQPAIDHAEAERARPGATFKHAHKAAADGTERRFGAPTPAAGPRVT